MTSMSSGESALVAFVVSAATTVLALAALRRFQVLDHPNVRSSHTVATPRGGGIGPALATVIALGLAPLVTTSGGPDVKLSLLVTATCFGLLGLVEDVRGVGVGLRLFLQTAMAILVLPLLLKSLTGAVAWRLVFAIGVVIWLVSFANVFNFMDGIDGLASAQVAVAGAVSAATGFDQHHKSIAIGGLVVASAILAFAPFNFPVARVFLGDVGSYFMGAWLAVMVVLELRAGITPEAAMAPVAVFIADACWTLARRVWRGESWLKPHCTHVYQRLVKMGWSHRRTTGLVAGVMATCSGLGAVSSTSSTLGRASADIALICVLAAYLASPELLARSGGRPPLASRT